MDSSQVETQQPSLMECCSSIQAIESNLTLILITLLDTFLERIICLVRVTWIY